MPLEVASCPNCGAPVTLSQHANAICAYCGTVITSTNYAESDTALSYLALDAVGKRLKASFTILLRSVVAWTHGTNPQERKRNPPDNDLKPDA